MEETASSKAESGLMAFRSHVLRPIDLSRPSNRMIVALTLVAAISAGVVTWTGGDPVVLLAPLYTFAIWALVREVDPDHDWSALLAAFAGGTWVVAGLDSSGLLLVAGLAVATRLVLNSTGRRPLPTDLVGLALIAAGLSFTTTGWVAGFAIAVAVYADDRMAEEQRSRSVVAAAVAALAASGVATLTSAFPERVPNVVPELVVPIGLLALISLVREPESPVSLVDSRYGDRMDHERLHAARSLLAAAIFGAAVLAGREAEAIGPIAIALVLALASNELERIQRFRT